MSAGVTNSAIMEEHRDSLAAARAVLPPAFLDYEESEEEESEVEDPINCQDSPTWNRTGTQNDNRNCVWVGKKTIAKTETRCNKDGALGNCTNTCHDQCPDSVNWGGVYGEIDCQNNSTWTRDGTQDDDRDCDWVGKGTIEKTQKRCTMYDAMVNCPNTCHVQCPDSVNWGGDEEIDCQNDDDWTRDGTPDDYRDCEWVKNKPEKTQDRCQMYDAMVNCPGICREQCPGSVNFPSSIPSGAPTMTPTTM